MKPPTLPCTTYTIVSTMSVAIVILTTLMGFVLTRGQPCCLTYTLLGAMVGVIVVPYVWASFVLSQFESDVSNRETLIVSNSNAVVADEEK